MALHHIGLCVLVGIGCTLAKPFITYSTLEGSTEEEEPNFTSSASTDAFSPEYRATTTAGPTHVEPDFLSRVVKFLDENLLLILVSSTFVLLVFLMIIGAVFMSRRRKVNAYYPSSFPSKMYVDHRDRTGGAGVFNEVPEKPATEEEAEPVDSRKQLQEDIVRAAKSLRTPSKPADHSPEDGSKPDGSILPLELPSPSEERRDCSDSSPSDEPLPEGDSEQLGPDVSKEPLIGRNLRPSSLHIHNDSATLQLIAGEKTAF